MSKTIAAPGEVTSANMIYCAEGSIRLPSARSGQQVKITKSGDMEPLSAQDTLDMVPDFQIDDQTARLFGGNRRLASYDLDHRQTDAKNIAIELQDFARAIIDNRPPEVTGQIGLDAVALIYAMLESGLAHRPVTFSEIVGDQLNDYQNDANEYMGL
jgi:predicted dehydrogenase